MRAGEPPRDLASIRTRLDEALLRLRQIADRAVPLREAERLIGASLVHVYRALECSDDYGEFHDALNHALERARAALHLLGQIDTDDGAAARELVSVAQIVRDLRRIEYAPEPEGDSPRPAQSPGGLTRLRASKLVPTLLDIDRAYIFPAVPLPPEEEEPLDQPTSQGPVTAPDLDTLLARALSAADEADRDGDEPPGSKDQGGEGRATPMAPALDDELEREYVGVQLCETDVLLDRARVCFEELATFGAMRRPLEDQPWVGRDKPERRLLARIDAIVACGPWVFPHLVKMLEERPLPDPEMTWAAIFLCGSIAGADSLDQAIRVARAAPLDLEPVRRAVIDALAHAPHPQVNDTMRGWLGDADAAARSVAVAVLARRRGIGLSEALRATHDQDERVVVAGAAAAGMADGLPTGIELEALLRDARSMVAGAAMTSAILRRVEAGALRATELTMEGRSDFGQAALLAAVAGRGGSVLQALRSAMGGGAKSKALIGAVGWFGHASLVEPLLDQLRDGEPSLHGATVEALQRITGATLTEQCPEPTYARDDLPFTRGYRAPEVSSDLVDDPDAWTTWWHRHGRSAEETARYRFGHRWSVRDDLWELDSAASRADRWLAYLELVARTGGTLPFDPEAFVSQQRQQVSAWREHLAHRLAAPPQDGWAVQYVR
jgi:hypothetical protein